LNFLPTITTYKIDSKKLTIIGSAGKELVFEETGTVSEK